MFGTIFLICQGYKENLSVYNKIEGGMIVLLGFLCGGFVILFLASVMNYHHFLIPAIASVIVISILPLVYISVLTIHWFYCRKNIIKTYLHHVFHSEESQSIGNCEDNNQLLDPSY